MEKLSQKRIDELLSLEKDVKESERKNKDYRLRRNAKQHLLIVKAINGGITVTVTEIDNHLKSKK